eukprot:3945352-Prymnesium_polylepis.1
MVRPDCRQLERRSAPRAAQIWYICNCYSTLGPKLKHDTRCVITPATLSCNPISPIERRGCGSWKWFRVEARRRMDAGGGHVRRERD